MTTDLPEGIWQPLPDEPQRWYARFDCFRSLGPERTIAAAYRAHAGPNANDAGRPSKTWYAMAARWRWEERALAWDVHMRTYVRAREHVEAWDAHRQRVTRIGEFLDEFSNALSKALDPATLDQETARRLLPQLRRGFVEMIKRERIEMGEDPPPGRRRPKREEQPQVAATEQSMQALLARLELVYGAAAKRTAAGQTGDGAGKELV